MRITLTTGCSVDPNVISSSPLLIEALLAWGDKWKINDNPPTWDFPPKEWSKKELQQLMKGVF